MVFANPVIFIQLFNIEFHVWDRFAEFAEFD